MRIFPSLTVKLSLYDSLDTLKILTFWSISKDKNVLLLDKNYFIGKKYNQKDIDLCEQTWLKLFDEHYTLRNSQDAKTNLVKSFNELKQKEKITQVSNAIEFLQNIKKNVGFIDNESLIKYEQECYALLTKIDKRIKPLFFDGVDANIVNLGKVLKSMINKYNLDFNEKDKQVKKEIQNVYDVVANAESWLDRHLDVENMSVSRWIAYENQIQEKQKAQQKAQAKNGTR